jgi:hypothetical protein
LGHRLGDEKAVEWIAVRKGSAFHDVEKIPLLIPLLTRIFPLFGRKFSAVWSSSGIRLQIGAISKT